MSIRNSIIYILLLLVAACASIGTPDGGPYDETPPVFLTSTPAANALNAKEQKVVLEFDEFIKLQNAYEKIVVSPPQLQQPEIKANGKRITVELFDTLKPGTTYTIDFNDAIVDNNEGNPLEAFSFVFSTGDVIDTLGISGTVLEASNLEPLKGALVGVHSDLSDSAFNKKPFERVSRTDSRGRFFMRGLAPGKYRVYALADANGNYLFDQKSEKIAYLDSLVIPYATPSWRNDTIWRDSLTIDTIKRVPYMRLRPDNIVLRTFNVPLNQQYLVKNQRDIHRRFKFFFAAPLDSLPQIKGLDFDADEAFVIESNATNDTILYWLKDSTIYNRDTLTLAVTYPVPDSLEILHPRTDTITLVPRKGRARILAEEKEEYEKREKEFLKNARKEKDYDKNNPPRYIPPVPKLKINTKPAMDVNRDYLLTFDEPLSNIDTSAIHLYQIVDSVPRPIPHILRQSEHNIRNYVIYAEWRPEQEYKIEIDSAAFTGLYGHSSDKFQQSIKFRSLDEYAVLRLNIPGTGNNAVVQLLGKNDQPFAEAKTEKNRCTFYFIPPGKYYMRLFIDRNGNGKWDTGHYGNGTKQQPEEVYYYPRMLDLRAMFEYDQDDWNINSPLQQQKPLEITKQKPQKERVKRSRNAERKFK